MQLCPTICSYLLLPSKMAAAHERLYSSILRSGTLQGIAQTPLYSVPTPKVKYGVHDHSTAFHLYVKEQLLLTVYQSSC